MRINKRKIMTDMTLNLLSSLLLTSVLQMAVYPFISSQNSGSVFGNILTITGLCNAVGVMFGASLNNVLLVKYHSYELEEIKRNFLKLFVISTVATGIIIISILISFSKLLNVELQFSLLLYTILIMFRSFFTVFYRLDLNYNRIIKHSIFTSLGYIVGLLVYGIYPIWTLIFLIGEFSSGVYLLKTIKIKVNFSNIKYPLNKGIRMDFGNFFFSSAIANIMLYLDRLLINPFLGASQVAVFFSASIIGKLLSLIMQPLSSVILSYLSKETVENGYQIFKKSLIVSIVSGSIFFVFAYYITPILLKLLYPDLFNKAMSIYVLCNLLAILTNISVMLQPLTFKFCPMYWQTVIQVTYFVLYFVLAVIFMAIFGLKGFIVGNILASLIKIILIVILMLKYTKNNKRGARL